MSDMEELRRYYDNTDMSESIRRATADTTVAEEVMVSTSIRLPQSLMDRVRTQAARAGVPATTLMRQWVTDRLDDTQSATVISVPELERFIAERAHPAA